MRELTPEEKMQLKAKLEQTQSEKVSRRPTQKGKNSKERIAGIIILVLMIAAIIGFALRFAGIIEPTGGV